MGPLSQRIMVFLLLHIWSLVVILSLFWHFRIESLFVLAAIPIIWSGWLFPRIYILYSASFLFTLQSLGLLIFGMAQHATLRAIVPGIISYSIFMSISFVLNLTKAMSRKIQTLNERLSEKNKELHSLSFRDPLTNLHNRRYVWEFISQQASNFTQQMSLPEALSRAVSVTDKTMVIIIVDLDHFKQINDQYGHDAGDRVLIQVARRIRAAVRFDDVVVRWGGEEFLILCPLVQKENVDHVVRKVQIGINTDPMEVKDDLLVPVTASLGMIAFPPVPSSPRAFSFEQCIALADKALYTSKESGRNQVQKALITGNPEEIFSPQGTSMSGAMEIDSRFVKYVRL